MAFSALNDVLGIPSISNINQDNILQQYNQTALSTNVVGKNHRNVISERGDFLMFWKLTLIPKLYLYEGMGGEDYSMHLTD